MANRRDGATASCADARGRRPAQTKNTACVLADPFVTRASLPMQLVKSLAMALGALVILGVSAVSASAATCAVSTPWLQSPRRHGQRGRQRCPKRQHPHREHGLDIIPAGVGSIVIPVVVHRDVETETSESFFLDLTSTTVDGCLAGYSLTDQEVSQLLAIDAATSANCRCHSWSRTASWRLRSSSASPLAAAPKHPLRRPSPRSPPRRALHRSYTGRQAGRETRAAC